MSSTPMFDDHLLHDFMDTFYGYGNYAGDYWFVGMEEGGGDSFNNIVQRLQAWHQRGRLELEDVAVYHAEIGEEWWFSPQPKLQPTWNRLIRIELSAKGQDVHTEHVRAYQKEHWGRLNGTNCLVELLPLPSPSLGHWLYAEHSQLPYLVSRDTYTKHYAESRAEHLQQRILEYRPKAVIFYSANPGYILWWKRIAGVEFRKETIVGFPVHIAKNEHTVFAITYHPGARGPTYDYPHQVGQIIAAECFM